MSSNTSRRVSDTDRVRGLGNPVRRWLAIILVISSVASALWLFNRDIDWEARRREARNLGLTAEHNGNHHAAKTYYEAALANQPYDWETHVSLAEILNRHLGDRDGALRHYLYALAYSPEPSVATAVSGKVAVLRMIRGGELEDPLDALEDMFQAMEVGAEDAFNRRLAPKLRQDFAAYWKAWTLRGRGVVTSCKITNEANGFYDAVLEMDYPDNTTMSMHFRCPVQDIWRLELGFP